MARKTIGSVLEGVSKFNGKKEFYVKINEDVVLRKGQSIQLRSKQDQIEGAQAAMEAGKLSPEIVAKIIERLDKYPEYVKFDLILTDKA